MRPIRLLPVMALVASALLLTPVIHAQSTGTPPAARALLPASVLATLLQNSVHVSGTVAISAAGVPAGTLNLTGDAAWQDQTEGSFHLASSSPLVSAGLGASSADLVFVGQKLASRIGSGAWQCSGVSGTPTTAKTPATPKTSKAKSKSSGKSKKKGTKTKKSTSGSGTAVGSTAILAQAMPQLGQPVDLGAETLDAVTVWHVQAKSTGSTPGTASIDLYISQSDLTVKRVVVHEAMTASPALDVTATIDLSQYGEAVSVSLPAACASTARAMTSAQRTWASTVSRLLNPRSLLALTGR